MCMYANDSRYDMHKESTCSTSMLYHDVVSFCGELWGVSANWVRYPKFCSSPQRFWPGTFRNDQSCARLGKPPQAELGNAWRIPHKGCISFNESSQIWSNSQWWDLCIRMTTLLRGSQTRTYSCKSWAPRGVPGEMFPWQDEVQPSAAVQGEKSRTFWMSWGLGICWIWTQGT